jgi:hypothetical protein
LPTDDQPDVTEFPLDVTLTVGSLREALVGVADNVELSFDTFHLDPIGHTTFVPGRVLYRLEVFDDPDASGGRRAVIALLTDLAIEEMFRRYAAEQRFKGSG